jgi:hypothetical protein
MNDNVIRKIGVTNQKLSDKVCLGTEDLTLSAVAQSLPFTGISKREDVGGVIIKVRKTGSPTDSTYLLRYTQAKGAAPTTILGMWFGDGDVFEVNNNENVINFKVIATDATFGTLTIEYYGK